MISQRVAEDGRTSYKVKCSFIQIYQEGVYDLLADSVPGYVRDGNGKSSTAAAAATGLRVRWNAAQDFYVENLYTFDCPSAKVARNYFLNGMKKRLVASHKMNASSSRSHCIFTLEVTKRATGPGTGPGGPGEVEVKSKLALVDLAGR